MMDWEPHVGMRVVCVNADPSFFVGGWRTTDNSMDGLMSGTVYTIRDVGEFCGILQIWLMEISRPPRGRFDDGSALPEFGYQANRFRPLDERRLDIFRSILTKAPTEKELA